MEAGEPLNLYTTLFRPRGGAALVERSVMNRQIRSVLYVGGLLLCSRAVAAEPGPSTAWQRIAPAFSPPTEFAEDYGNYRSPLKFNDGREVKTAEDWRKRREEILATWHGLMGPWP